MENNNIGVQLYSVRDMASENFERALREVSELGYKSVETAGFFGHSAEQIKEWLDKYNLDIIGTHTGFADLDEDFENTVKFHKTLGNNKFVVPGVNISTKEELDDAVEKFNKYQPMLAEYGIELGYHNHHREFLPNDDGLYPNEYFAEKTNIKFQIDTFWVFVANRNPLDVLDEYKDRLIGTIHLKDGVRYPEVKGLSVGSGAAPVLEVIAKANDMNLDMIVESEDLQPTGIEEVARCAEFLGLNK